jgi:NADH-quinone oxidoreductase subunit L
VTFATFLMGSLALAGFPFFSGFFSKDEIIHAAFNQHPVLGSIGLFTAVLTAVYTFRMVFVAFCGQERLPEGMHPHESGRWMLVPMILLAIGAVFAGYAGVTIHAGGFAGFLGTHGPFQAFLAPVVAPFREAAANLHAASYPSGGETAASEAGHAMMYASGALAIAGVLFAHIFYLRRRDWAEAVRREVPEVCTLLNNKYFVDELYDFVIVRPLWQVGRTFYAVDQWVIDGILWFIASVPQMIGSIFRVLQSGALQGYGLAMAGGVVLIVLIVWSLR